MFNSTLNLIPFAFHHIFHIKDISNSYLGVCSFELWDNVLTVCERGQKWSEIGMGLESRIMVFFKKTGPLRGLEAKSDQILKNEKTLEKWFLWSILTEMMDKLSFVKEKGCFWKGIFDNKRVDFDPVSKGFEIIWICTHFATLIIFLWIFSFELKELMVRLNIKVKL